MKKMSEKGMTMVEVSYLERAGEYTSQLAKELEERKEWMQSIQNGEAAYKLWSDVKQENERLMECLFPDVTKAGHYVTKIINGGLYDALKAAADELTA